MFGQVLFHSVTWRTGAHGRLGFGLRSILLSPEGSEYL